MLVLRLKVLKNKVVELDEFKVAKILKAEKHPNADKT